MITIDGSRGEGGGQIVRTALSLSAITKTPVTINNVRRGREKAGLQIQHLTAAHAIAELTHGKLTGDQLYSDTLSFEPGEASSGSFEFDVQKIGPSAGSAPLIFQQILPILIFTNNISYVVIKGGTDVGFSPPIDFVRQTFIPVIEKMGIHSSLEVLKRGFYPMGGGEIKTTIKPLTEKIKSINIKERGKIKHINGSAVAANLPASLADRELKHAHKMLTEANLPCQFNLCMEEAAAKSAGNVFFLSAEYENVLAGFSRLGELGKPAEKVAGEAITDFLTYHSGNLAVERHLADQILIYMALAEGKSEISVELTTAHLKTNIEIIEQFLPLKFEVSNNIVSVQGIGQAPRS